MMGLKPEVRDYWTAGKEAHAIIQAHVSNKKKHPFLNHIELTFPIVEEKDFDERCKFNFPVKVGTNKGVNEYNMIGFYDGLDFENKRFLEIKSSDPLWSVGKFQKAMQRKVYSLANPKLKEAILITCSKKIENWEKAPPKVFKVPLTEQDRREATSWIASAIQLLMSGDFTGGLEDGVCRDRWCYFGNACSFKVNAV